MQLFFAPYELIKKEAHFGTLENTKMKYFSISRNLIVGKMQKKIAKYSQGTVLLAEFSRIRDTRPSGGRRRGPAWSGGSSSRSGSVGRMRVRVMASASQGGVD